VLSTPFKLGGYAASALLVVLGIAMVVLGFVGRGDVHDRLSQEQIVGTPDSSIPNEPVNTGSEAKAFADVIRKHTLEATGGKTYAEMPRAVFKSTGESVPEQQADQALASGRAIDNPEREIWITSTALSTALNTSYFAESVATFTIVVGVALLLIGIGLLVLTRGLVSRDAAEVRGSA
jgi:putative Mn2+ efflux pump MntP